MPSIVAFNVLIVICILVSNSAAFLIVALQSDGLE
jgi:hypothetical protein